MAIAIATCADALWHEVIDKLCMPSSPVYNVTVAMDVSHVYCRLWIQGYWVVAKKKSFSEEIV